jgi:hypothetical protein
MNYYINLRAKNSTCISFIAHKMIFFIMDHRSDLFVCTQLVILHLGIYQVKLVVKLAKKK